MIVIAKFNISIQILYMCYNLKNDIYYEKKKTKRCEVLKDKNLCL